MNERSEEHSNAALYILAVVIFASALILCLAIFILAYSIQQHQSQRSSNLPLPPSAVASSSPPLGFRPDIGPRVHQFGRPAGGFADHVELGQTGFIASVGDSTYQDESNTDPDFYSISVQSSLNAGPSYVYFERQFTIAELPPDFIDKPIDDIVSYDDATRTVTFQIGNEQYQYQLPGP